MIRDTNVAYGGEEDGCRRERKLIGWEREEGVSRLQKARRDKHYKEVKRNARIHARDREKCVKKREIKRKLRGKEKEKND